MAQSISQSSGLNLGYLYEFETGGIAAANNSDKKTTEKKTAEVFGYGINLI